MKAGALLYVLVGATLLLTVVNTFRAGTPSGVADDTRLAAIEERLAGLEDVVRETRDDARRAARASAGSRRQPLDVGALGTIGASSGSGMQDDAGNATLDPDSMGRLEDAVAERVERALDRRAAEDRSRGWDGQWKPPIEQVTTSLDLDEAQEEALRVTFDAARDELLSLLMTQRADGGSVIDDFVDDLHLTGDGAAAFKRFLGKLTASKIPGDDQTYFTALAESAERIRGDAEARLDEAQKRRFRTLRIDVFDVKTGYDPVGDYVRRRLEELGQ